jgi:hypothetical protein
VYATNIYTVTSCAPVVTDCPSRIGKVTTEIVSLFTTVCPVTAASYKPEFTTSTAYSTKTYTVTACAPTVTNCPYGSRSIEVVTSTTICPLTYTEYSTEIFYATSAYVVEGVAKTTYVAASSSVHTKIDVPATGIIANPVAVATSTSTAKGYVMTTAKPSATPTPSTVAFTGAATSLKVGGLLVAGFLAALMV